MLEVPLRECDRLSKLIPVWQGRSKSLDDALKDIREFEMAAKSTDPAVKDFAQKTLPTLREHLKMAQEAKASAATPQPVTRSTAPPVQAGAR